MNSTRKTPTDYSDLLLLAFEPTDTGLQAYALRTCLTEGTFLPIWKRQRLVLIRKKGKPNEDPSSYRPLCMLDTVGKILEQILLTRLEKVLTNAGGLSPNKYGFCRRKSTIDATERVHQIAREANKDDRWMYGTKEYCLVVTTDVKTHLTLQTGLGSELTKIISSAKIP